MGGHGKRGAEGAKLEGFDILRVSIGFQLFVVVLAAAIGFFYFVGLLVHVDV